MPTEALDSLLASRPQQGLLDRVRAAGTELLLTPLQLEAVVFLDADLARLAAETNEAVTAAELSTRRRFFATIEKSPLSEEQARAVVCFDNRVHVLAAAGSGKTSVMVARAAYAVSRRYVRPEKILLLAFNKAAAVELQERVDARFAAAGIDSSGVRASTFHSFGLDVIGQATGTKPRLASWLDRGDGLDMVERIVDELRDRNEQFRYGWDLYRLLYSRAPINIDEHEPDGWDADSKENGYRTAGGDVVRSHGERLVADFLYYNGVRYVYERPYPHRTGDATHGQYRPDFYYPDIDLWHEHWALGRDGKPPAAFTGYEQGMAWKRATHARYGTTLIETTFAGVLWGDDLIRLAENLTSRGLSLDWNPDRRPKDEWAKPVKHEEMYRLVRTFMSHVKSNSWTREILENRLQGDLQHLAGSKTRMFLDLYWAVAAEWERRLAAEGAVDFEDMLVAAADQLETGRADLGYELIMVDEFQDASRARARLVRGLVSKPGRYLLAVGDDWQSINRFAGADLSVMTDFAAWFGRGPRLALTTTFRCPQTICDTASAFISKNPRQFTKPMRSAQAGPGAPVDILRSPDTAAALAGYLKGLSEGVADGTVPRGRDGTVTVHVLGRYRHEASVMPRLRPHNLDVTFHTVHSAKGLEADYIVVPGMTTGTYGFPSTITDDPVLHLAMPAPDTYDHAEERRLFYVALTRARCAVTLITDPQRMSPFVVELLASGNVTVDGRPVKTADGQGRRPSDGRAATAVQICPRCEKGTLVERHGRYGPFFGCSAFPACTYTRSLSARSGTGPGPAAPGLRPNRHRTGTGGPRRRLR
ncbi:MAG: UvrD-helicase domain-containing protein [Acidimicrobiales bacterium]|nr:UvrD-helicase domain-containing protein [Acidimicrobiales bacterium]